MEELSQTHQELLRAAEEEEERRREAKRQEEFSEWYSMYRKATNL